MLYCRRALPTLGANLLLRAASGRSAAAQPCGGPVNWGAREWLCQGRSAGEPPLAPPGASAGDGARGNEATRPVLLVSRMLLARLALAACRVLRHARLVPFFSFFFSLFLSRRRSVKSIREARACTERRDYPHACLCATERALGVILPVKGRPN